MYVKGDNEMNLTIKPTLVQILQLRAKKAKLLGFPLCNWNLSNKWLKHRAHNGVDDVSMGACGCASA
jgi:Zn-dependent oligopeptidase